MSMLTRVSLFPRPGTAEASKSCGPANATDESPIGMVAAIDVTDFKKVVVIATILGLHM